MDLDTESRTFPSRKEWTTAIVDRRQIAMGRALILKLGKGGMLYPGKGSQDELMMDMMRAMQHWASKDGANGKGDGKTTMVRAEPKFARYAPQTESKGDSKRTKKSESDEPDEPDMAELDRWLIMYNKMTLQRLFKEMNRISPMIHIGPMLQWEEMQQWPIRRAHRDAFVKYEDMLRQGNQVFAPQYSRYESREDKNDKQRKKALERAQTQFDYERAMHWQVVVSALLDDNRLYMTHIKERVSNTTPGLARKWYGTKAERKEMADREMSFWKPFVDGMNAARKKRRNGDSDDDGYEGDEGDSDHSDDDLATENRKKETKVETKVESKTDAREATKCKCKAGGQGGTQVPPRGQGGTQVPPRSHHPMRPSASGPAREYVPSDCKGIPRWWLDQHERWIREHDPETDDKGRGWFDIVCKMNAQSDRKKRVDAEGLAADLDDGAQSLRQLLWEQDVRNYLLPLPLPMLKLFFHGGLVPGILESHDWKTAVPCSLAIDRKQQVVGPRTDIPPELDQFVLESKYMLHEVELPTLSQRHWDEFVAFASGCSDSLPSWSVAHMHYVGGTFFEACHDLYSRLERVVDFPVLTRLRNMALAALLDVHVHLRFKSGDAFDATDLDELERKQEKEDAAKIDEEQKDAQVKEQKRRARGNLCDAQQDTGRCDGQYGHWHGREGTCRKVHADDWTSLWFNRDKSQEYEREAKWSMRKSERAKRRKAADTMQALVRFALERRSLPLLRWCCQVYAINHRRPIPALSNLEYFGVYDTAFARRVSECVAEF